MSRHWKEKADPEKHVDYMSTTHVGGMPYKPDPRNGDWVYFVNACSFTFQFVSTDQLRQALIYFSQKVHPARREFNNGLEHYWQRWYERLPKGLTAESKRVRIKRAFEKALEEFKGE